MGQSAITQTLEAIGILPDEIRDEQLAKAFRIMLQLIEGLYEENEKVKEENQKLRDAINLLKGEQAKPDIKSSRKKPNEDISSEEERKSQKTSKKKKSKAKKHKIKIDRIEVCKVDQNILPDDAEFKGYQNVVVQEIIIKTDNVEYKKEIYYSSSQNKTYMGELPPEIKGEFGPGVKSLVCTLKHVANVSEPKIHELLDNFGIFISPASISRIITKNNELFHQEKADIFLAGLLSTDYQQIDDTSSRVRGQNYYTQIVCNPYYTAYFTAPHKDRLTVLDILRGDPDSKTRSYLFNEEAFDLLERFGLSNKLISQLRERVSGKILDEVQMQQLLGCIFPDPGKGKIRRTRIMEAAAIAAYHQQTDFPIVEVLLSDDAPQYKLLIYLQALCWVHDGRNYKKLRPVVPEHREKLDNFRDKYWDYYQKLLQFGVNSSQEEAEALSAKFDQLFSTKTGYPALDERIAKSKAKKVKENLEELKERVEKTKIEKGLGFLAEKDRTELIRNVKTHWGEKGVNMISVMTRDKGVRDLDIARACGMTPREVRKILYELKDKAIIAYIREETPELLEYYYYLSPEGIAIFLAGRKEVRKEKVEEAKYPFPEEFSIYQRRRMCSEVG